MFVLMHYTTTLICILVQKLSDCVLVFAKSGESEDGASVLARASLMIMNGAQPSLLSSTGQGPGVCVKVFSSDWSTTSKTVLLLENMYTL